MKRNIIFTTIILLLTFVSCSDQDSSIHENDALEKDNFFKKTSEIERFGFVSLQLYDEFIKVGENKFNRKLIEFNSYIQDNNLENKLFSASEYSKLVVSFFNIDKSIIEEYMLLTIKYGKILKDNINNEQDIFKLGLVNYIETADSDNKWLFSTIANLVGAGCAGTIIAGMLDTSIMLAGMIITAPTGVGAVIGGVAVASSYANLIANIYECSH